MEVTPHIHSNATYQGSTLVMLHQHFETLRVCRPHCMAITSLNSDCVRLWKGDCHASSHILTYHYWEVSMTLS